MSEHEKFAISRLIGAPPGYRQKGEAMKSKERNPIRDPFEQGKAHPDVFNMMLQVLDDGFLTDSRAKIISKHHHHYDL